MAIKGFKRVPITTGLSVHWVSSGFEAKRCVFWFIFLRQLVSGIGHCQEPHNLITEGQGRALCGVAMINLQW